MVSVHPAGAVVLHSQRMSIVATIRKFYEDVQRQRREKSGPDVVFDTASIPGASGPNVTLNTTANFWF